MKSLRAVPVLTTLLFFVALVGCNASNNASDPAPENTTNEQEVAVAVALTQTATAIEEEAPLPEPEISEVTAVPEESTPEPEATSSDPVVEETTNAKDCPIPEITTNAYGPDVMKGQPSYRSELNGFCVYYPANFTVGDEIENTQFENGKTGNVVGIYGPALDESLDPVAASLNILVTESNLTDLSAIVDEYIAGTTYGSREAFDVSGIPAIMVREVPGRTLSTHLFMVNNGRVYQLSFYPVDPAFPQAQEDMGSLMNFIFQTWTFLE